MIPCGFRLMQRNAEFASPFVSREHATNTSSWLLTFPSTSEGSSLPPKAADERRFSDCSLQLAVVVDRNVRL